jgi:hypothetical protein
MEKLSALSYLAKRCSSKDRILLVNPPVIETRYQWIRWNQPLDLLKLSSYLKLQLECDVKLYDFMLPTNNKVVRTAAKPEDKIQVNGHSFNLWRYGKLDSEFDQWLGVQASKWRPTQIWLTSLTSYWWRGIATTITRLKNRYSDVPIVLYGQYPRLESAHAAAHCYADALIHDEIDLHDYAADLDLYEIVRPSFCALDIRSQTWPDEVREHLQCGISNFVFFNDPLIQDPVQFTDRLNSFCDLKLKSKTNVRPKFFGLCGLYPSAFTSSVAEAMKEAGFVELHFEYETEGGDLRVDAYRQVRSSLAEARFELQPDEVSGFIHIGLPSDDIERIIKHALNLFEVFGSVILKPWTATPASELYQSYKDTLETDRIERLSPHLFPFSKINGITPQEYEELYVLVAALNQKVRSRAFSCFPGTLAYQMINRSLAREVWNAPL